MNDGVAFVPAAFDAPFSGAVRIGELLFVSGQASVDEDGRIVPDTFEGEFRRAIANLRAVLATAGCDLDRVVRVGAYVRDSGRLAEFNALYRNVFSEPWPARTTLTECLPSSLQFEIDCIAVLPAQLGEAPGTATIRLGATT